MLAWFLRDLTRFLFWLAAKVNHLRWFVQGLYKYAHPCDHCRYTRPTALKGWDACGHPVGCTDMDGWEPKRGVK